MPRPFYSQKTDPVPLIQEAGWAQGSVRKGAENSAPPLPPGFDPRKPACSESPYRLPYPGPQNFLYTNTYLFFFLVYVMSWFPHLGQILRQLPAAHSMWSRLGFDQ